MKKQLTVPRWLWYAPVITGWSYIAVCVLLFFAEPDSKLKPLGDFLWNIGFIFIVLSMLLFHKLDLNGKGWWRKFSLFIPVIGSLSFIRSAHYSQP